MTVIKDLLKSKKFIAAIVAVIAQIALQLGWELDEVAATSIISPLIAYVLGQAAVDVKKAGMAGSAAAIALVLGIGGSSIVSSGCTSGQRAAAGRVAAGMIDCMTPSAKTAIGELGPAFGDILRNATGNDGSVDGARLKEIGKSLKTPAAQCALAAVVAEALRPRAKSADTPQSAELEPNPDQLRAAFNDLRAQAFGSATFQLEAGPL